MRLFVIFLLLTGPVFANQRLQEYQDFLNNLPEKLFYEASAIVVVADKVTGIEMVIIEEEE